MNYERNQPSFSMKFKTENGDLNTDKTLTLILPDLFIIQCGLNYKKVENVFLAFQLIIYLKSCLFCWFCIQGKN